MSQLSEAQILETLKSVADPDSGKDIVASGMVQGLKLKDGHVAFAIEVDPAVGGQMEPLRKEAEEKVHALDGVLTVSVVLTAERSAPQSPAQQAGQANAGGGGKPAAKDPNAPLMPTVKSIVAVASGKGGVGKSTTSVNLALALASKGLKVGILDADIYGPSIPRMLGLSGSPVSVDNDKVKPMENHGVKCMSIGFLVDEDTPMIWRGPMVMGALEQLMRDVDWGEIDIMVVDMPPGTGDAQLTMAQRVPLAGAVVVSTPQDIALLDAKKGLNMFRKTEVPVFGIVENMSYFLCPKCGERTEIFNHGGARKTAIAMGADFLGEIPLDMAIRENADAGTPIVVTQPESAHTAAYKDIADAVWDKVETIIGAPSSGPAIVFD